MEKLNVQNIIVNLGLPLSTYNPHNPINFQFYDIIC